MKLEIICPDEYSFPRLCFSLEDNCVLCEYIDKETHTFDNTFFTLVEFTKFIKGYLALHPDGSRYTPIEYTVNDMNESIVKYEQGVYEFEVLIDEV